MRVRTVPLAKAMLVSLTAAGFADAPPTGKDICRKLIADGRGGSLSQDDCLCLHRVAEAVLDDDNEDLPDPVAN